MDLPLADAAIDKLLAYLALLHKWNKTYNLSGITDPAQMLTLHLLDSLSLSSHLSGVANNKPDVQIADVGTGAGLPGIPLAICHPDKQFVLIDSNGKKTRFLFEVKLRLDLPNISIVNSRIEHYQTDRQIDIVMCRAYSTLAQVLDQSRHLLTSGSLLLAMKGQYPDQEINQLPKGFKLSRVSEWTLPGTEQQRHIIEVLTV